MKRAFIPDYRQWPLALLRILIGWHFLYEAWSKFLYPGWTSAGYLKSSTGPLAGFFHWLAADAGVIRIIDGINVWGLLLIGSALMLGLLTRAAAVSGMALLALYYFSYPPLFAPITHGVSEGSYLIVNKNLIELGALAVIAVFPSVAFGLDGLLARRGRSAGSESAVDTPSASGLDQPAPEFLSPMSRRGLFTGLAGVPFMGGFVLAVLKKHGWKSFEEVQLGALPRDRDTFVAGPTVRTFQFTRRSDLKGRLPEGKIGLLRLSRMILGGNLIGGWAHARDLLYASKLVKAYHHRDKVFETLALAESCGVNTILTNPALCGVINDYWRNGGKIQFISDSGGKDLLVAIQKSVDQGACACYIHGGVADRLVQEGKFDLMAQGLELIRRNGLPAGIGGHKLETIRGSVENGLRPDFWMKTFHQLDYWSAATKPENDNIWCESPTETAAYMEGLEQPWIAYKILAAGAIEPKAGFRHAFENGADFICVGMYDFQIVDDVNIALAVLNGGLARARPWCA